MESEGVRVHGLTDAEYDQMGLSPANSTVEEASRRGKRRLPLKAGDWNGVMLCLEGNVVTVTLNGERAYERTLEPGNGRQFEFFHYADETEARVRRVRYEGQWPRTLPPDLGLSSPKDE